MTDFLLTLFSWVLMFFFGAYVAGWYLHIPPHDYLLRAMRARRVAAGDDWPAEKLGECCVDTREFSLRQGARWSDYYHELAHLALADHYHSQQASGAEEEALADIISWLLCRLSGHGNSLSLSYSIADQPLAVVLSLNDVRMAFLIADNMIATLQQGGLPVTKPTQPKEQ